ncbi:MAG: hypothetical protein K2X90_01690 [Candidatus Babeliaceae bacterium]|nr:hypothetical protein [Candidatus Babeliaceae bacterium]
MELIWNEYNQLENKPFQAYRSHLEEFVLSKKEEYSNTLFENIPLSEQKLINGAEYLLAVMQITALGGFRWPDDGVKRLEKLIKRFATNSETFPAEFTTHFIDYCMFFLEYARNYADNLLEIDFSQALLYSLKPGNEYLAINFLKTIIYSPDEIDSGLKNKSRALLIKLLIRQNTPANMVEILHLLSGISEDTLTNAGVYPEDADYAEQIEKLLYP